MNRYIVYNFIKQEISGWKPFEVIWLLFFIAAQIWAYIQSPDSALAMISGIAGLICVVLVSKGKISNYFFGLIFAYTYFYVAWGNNFIGEMNSVLYVYLPAQFIGYFVWKANLQQDSKGSTAVIAKSLSLKGWIILLLGITVSTLLFIQALKVAGGSSTGLDGLTTITTFTAQLLMILRYREQWILWIALNILSILLWAETPAMYLMYVAYLLNSLYGLYNWSKLQTS
ncbi:nicotinamide riboside transporter PnuC [[Haemophilus] ducreyi]|uniref:nicotinamide riboside transporter PnuC n=1 Tax=Haemophilus ducreyi TaxID=730 RepID=UPI000654D68B|nr:nicotinamide riboside transporter PnuC [[Haemophilus] ducreyi]AKO45368.1 nicotinamide riboside transporter pnuC [[Haemophilus] ducreyi]AKO46753.1 nicotinamide riboside transporter pnuC [[Haemophilus] ducreyi]AKO48093.1 nicotinamide riboside transporter pnuC [[Haemophilus] ducreyi]AKO49479.1 nicotinamide riboside transporter pnuC [[Haemophilus] ducreyi]ANF61484.1 nicotinamide riboside transporter pnuC [[Haemophilus] ducreyi]